MNLYKLLNNENLIFFVLDGRYLNHSIDFTYCFSDIKSKRVCIKTINFNKSEYIYLINMIQNLYMFKEYIRNDNKIYYSEQGLKKLYKEVGKING